MSRDNRPLEELRNIGKTVAQRLREVGIRDAADLEEVGPVEAYQRMAARHPERTLPVCYYLYSLQGALMDLPWDELPKQLKHDLEGQVRPKTRARRTRP